MSVKGGEVKTSLADMSTESIYTTIITPYGACAPKEAIASIPPPKAPSPTIPTPSPPTETTTPTATPPGDPDPDALSPRGYHPERASGVPGTTTCGGAGTGSGR